MQQTETSEKESKLEKEKIIKYKETAHVRLKWLHFQWNKSRELNVKNVKDLKLCFWKDCCHLDMCNHIPTVINKQHLDSALQISRILEGELSKNSQHEYSDLDFWASYQLECLHRWHRIKAAKQALLSSDKWWTVDLYLAGMIQWYYTNTCWCFRHQ